MYIKFKYKIIYKFYSISNKTKQIKTKYLKKLFN
jgi:hypothetical protein